MNEKRKQESTAEKGKFGLLRSDVKNFDDQKKLEEGGKKNEKKKLKEKNQNPSPRKARRLSFPLSRSFSLETRLSVNRVEYNRCW